MNKYLVIIDYDTGFAELSNVAIIKANSEEEARNIYRKETRMCTENRNIYVKDLNGLYGNWYYFN